MVPASWERDLDRALHHAVKSLPGVVVLAKNGDRVYHKAFGHADLEHQVPMTENATFRMYSMTKVMCSAVALILRDRFGEPMLDDPVSKFIASFNRQWEVVEEADGAAEAVDIQRMATGTASSAVAFRRRPAVRTMCVKDLMAECSGVGYDIFSDLDTAAGGKLGTRQGYAIANAIRRKLCPTLYTSSCILGHDLTLEQFCDTIAEAGVLCTDPGVFSYGLGATVLGRVVEVVYARHCGPKRLRDIFSELLFSPLDMRSAVFYDAGLAQRLPQLCGAKPAAEDGQVDVVAAEQSVPPSNPPYTNHSDHFAGPMKYDSGDTGSAMTVADYAKFLDCLLRGGSAPDGTSVLSTESATALLSGRHVGLCFGTGVAHMMGLSDDGAVFTYGWASQERTDAAPKQNYWSGYANTHFRLYPENDGYIIIGIQCMDHHGTGFVDRTLRGPLLEAFARGWTGEAA